MQSLMKNQGSEFPDFLGQVAPPFHDQNGISDGGVDPSGVSVSKRPRLASVRIDDSSNKEDDSFDKLLQAQGACMKPFEVN